MSERSDIVDWLRVRADKIRSRGWPSVDPELMIVAAAEIGRLRRRLAVKDEQLPRPITAPSIPEPADIDWRDLPEAP